MTAQSSYAAQVDPMTRLQNRWYNCLVGQLSLSPAMFQIMQPALPLAPTDLSLWASQNLLPPASLTFDRHVESGVLFFDEYNAVASQMQFPESSFAQDIGEENYRAWKTYVNQQSPTPAENQLPALFQQWAAVNAPAVASAGVAALTEMLLANAARQALQPYQGPHAKPVDFTGTSAHLWQTLSQTSGFSLLFDSNALSVDVGNTWTGGKNVGVDGLWAGCSKNSRLSRMFAASRVTLSVLCQSFTVWASIPGSWYNSSWLNIGYSSRATPPWPANANPTWDEVFGPDGSMQRLIASLIVVDGINATVTSDAIYSLTDQHTIITNAPRGLWPFYTPANSANTSVVVTFDEVTGLKLETITQPGHPLVIGVNVLGIAAYLGHGSP